MVGPIGIPTTPRGQNRGRRPRSFQRGARFSLAGQRLNVAQRYVYSPYGALTILNADFSTPREVAVPDTAISTYGQGGVRRHRN